MSEELNIDEKLAEIDSSIALQEWYIKRGEALEKLKEDENFQLVVLEGYFNVEAERVYTMLTDPRVVKLEDKQSYISQLETIKDMIRYLGNDTYKGTVAIQAINAKKEIDELIRMKQDLLNKGEI